MFRGILCAGMALVAAAVAAHADPRDDLTAAVAKLGNAANFSWTSTAAGVVGITPAVQEGRTEKGGFTSVTSISQDNTMTVYLKGGKAVVKTEGGYQTTGEIQAANQVGGFNPSMFAVYMANILVYPADQVRELAGKLSNLALANGVYTADLDEATAKALLDFGRAATPAGAADVPPPAVLKNARASIKIWITDGNLVKYELHTTGTMTFNDNDIDIDRTMTTEIKDVGSTKVDVPDEAKAKLNG